MMQTPPPDPAACGIFGHEMEAGRCACCGQPDPRQQPAEEAPAPASCAACRYTAGHTSWCPNRPRALEAATIPYHAQLLAMTDADLYAWHEEIARRLMALRSAPKGTRGGKLLRLTRETIQQERARRQAARYAPCSAGRRCGYFGACRCAGEPAAACPAWLGHAEDEGGEHRCAGEAGHPGPHDARRGAWERRVGMRWADYERGMAD